MPAADPVVAFYSGGRDHSGRTLQDIIEWDDDRLEAVHDYIQWVFPTREPSGVNPFAPVVTSETERAFALDDALRMRLRTAFDRLLAFYGLRRSETRITVDGARFDERARVWLHPGSHNHLRLTRIIDSLSALGLPDLADALKRCLVEEVAPRGGASARTLQFWRAAGARPR
jgi:hypothetical protein